MSELSEAINEMRNMRESYDQIGAAAEAYNTGKTKLAQNITAKGVSASASETLPELAEKVAAIAQESYTIEGGEMYAKQLFGSLETPNYWNLYDILAQLLSDGRLVNYGGILLAEYYKGYDSLALSGAGAGGSYVVSDKDENGQFKMYTEDTTHTWATEDDGKGNRWVAYCFADEYHDFNITDTSTCPRSIFIGRKVGIIKSLVNGRISQICVPDGNELKDFRTGTYTQNFGKMTVLRNISHSGGTLFYNQPNIETLYVQLNAFTGGDIVTSNGTNFPNTIVFNCENCQSSGCLVTTGSQYGTPLTAIICKIQRGNLYITPNSQNNVNIKNLKIISITDVDDLTVGYSTYSDNYTADGFRLYVGYSEEYPTGGKFNLHYVNGMGNGWKKFKDLELQNGWNKPIDVSLAVALTEENMYSHILQKLKQDETGCGTGVTITLGATNLAKLMSEESVALLDSLTNVYGYTFA